MGNKVLLLIIGAYLIAGCNNSVGIRKSLSDAEYLMRERPDSALAVINGIDTSYVTGAKLKAKYALLYAIALDKNYIDTTDVSILSPALAYYLNKGSVEDRVKTLYYLGCIQSNAGDYDAACVSLLKSLKMAEGLDDFILKGQICAAIGIAYNNNYDCEEELIYQEQANSWFSLSGDSIYIDNGRYLLATAYHNNRMFDEADSLYSIVSEHGRFFPAVLLRIASNEIKRNSPNPGRACDYFQEAETKGARFLPEHWFEYAYSLCLAGRPSDVDRLQAKLRSYSSNPETYWWQYCIAKKRGDKDESIRVLELYHKYIEDVVGQQLKQSVYKAERNYYELESERAANKMQSSKVRFWTCITLLALLLLATLLVISQRGLHHQKVVNSLLSKYLESQRLLSEINSQLSGLSESNKKLANLRSSFISMYHSQFARIGELYMKNLDIALISDKNQDAYIAQVSSIISEVADGKNTQFESRLNMDLDGIMMKIRNDFPSLGEYNYRFLCLVIAGFKDSTIGLIMDMSNSAVRTRKSRLKKQILSSNTNNKDLYELFLG